MRASASSSSAPSAVKVTDVPFVAPKVNTVKMDLASAVLPLAAIVTLEAYLAANCVKAVAGRACKPDSLVISTV